MKKVFKTATLIAVIVILSGYCMSSFGKDNTASNTYSIKYSWPQKPKVGDYTLKVIVSDKDGNSVKDVDVIASYYMPSMRGHHDKSENMKLSDKGYFLLPIHFAMRGDWEIIISIEKDGREVGTKKILLEI